jgi:hypothetical protein
MDHQERRGSRSPERQLLNLTGKPSWRPYRGHNGGGGRRGKACSYIGAIVPSPGPKRATWAGSCYRGGVLIARLLPRSTVRRGAVGGREWCGAAGNNGPQD